MTVQGRRRIDLKLRASFPQEIFILWQSFNVVSRQAIVIFGSLGCMAKDISTDELKKAVQTLEEALQFAQQVRLNEVQFKIARDACIQRFEYCIELSWKVSLKKLSSLTKFPKQAVREMARADLITSAESWLDFIEASNNSSHSYDEETAQKVFHQILLFRSDVQNLIKKLDQLT